MAIMLEKMFFFRNLLVAHYHKCVILCLQYFSITRPSAPTARNDSIPLTESARLTLLPLWATSLRGSKHPKDISLKICETRCLVLNQRRGTPLYNSRKSMLQWFSLLFNFFWQSWIFQSMLFLIHFTEFISGWIIHIGIFLFCKNGFA